MVKFTVLTPSYNRAHTLKRVWRSLNEQKFKGFEWLIVDDGSSDGTETIVQDLIAAADFEIRYLYKENGGKHTAYNLGVTQAKGEFIGVLDSDDELTPDALALLDQYLVSGDENLVGIVGNVVDQEGKLVGKPYSKVHEGQRINFFELVQNGFVVGEKWGVHKREILLKNLFPEFVGEKFVPESLIWNRITNNDRYLCTNDVYRVYHQHEDGLSADMFSLRKKSPTATATYYFEIVQSTVPLGLKLKSLLAWGTFVDLVSAENKHFVESHYQHISFPSLWILIGRVIRKLNKN